MGTLLALTTTSCGNCPAVEKYLHTTEIPHSIIILDENHPDFAKNCKAHEATQAPTVILLEDAGEAWRVHSVEKLKEKLK